MSLDALGNPFSLFCLKSGNAKIEVLLRLCFLYACTRERHALFISGLCIISLLWLETIANEEHGMNKLCNVMKHFIPG